MADLQDDFENEKDLAASFENEPSAPKSDKDILKAGYNFEDMQKLSPEEHARFVELSKGEASKNEEAAGRGAAQGATLGFQPELSAKVERLMAHVFGNEGVQELYGNKSDKELADTYKQQNEAAKKASPAFYTGGQILGGTPTAIVAGGAGNLLGKGIQGATGLGNLASQTAGQTAVGSGFGAAQGLGNSKGSLTGTPEEQDQALSDIKQGATIGGAVPAAVGGAAAGLGALASPAGQEAAQTAAQGIQETANSQAVKSLEPSASQLASMNIKGQTQKIGQTLLNNDLVPTASTAAGRSEALQQFTKAAGQAQAPAAQAVDIQAAKLISQQSPEVQATVKKLLDPQGLVDHLQEEIMDPLMASGDPANTGPKVQELLDKVGSLGDQTGGQLSFNNLNMFRQRLDKMINFDAPRGSDLQNTLKQFRATLDDSLGDTAQKIDQLAGTNLANEFAQTKADYAAGVKATKLAAAQEARAEQSGIINSLAGRTGAGALAGKLVGNSGAGAALGAVSKIAQSPAINRFTANTLNTVAGVVRQAPETLGQYAAPLQQALTRGPEAFSAMIFTLNQRDPEFKKKYDALQDSQPNNPGQ